MEYEDSKKFPASRGLSRRGKNERKERDFLLPLIFASSGETSASRESENQTPLES